MLSHAAREHFRLPVDPFINDIQSPKDLFMSADQRYIREAMYYAARHSGLIAVVGESGSGKSTLRRDLLERLRRENEQITVIQPRCIDKSQLTAEHVCDAIIADISTEPPRRSLEAKARQIERLLAASARLGTSHVLIIEEAHDLTKATLRYLKRFWELEDGFRKLVGIILIGQPELGELLNERKNEDLRELIRRCEVARVRPLNGSLHGYLELKFARVGGRLSDVVDDETRICDAIRARLQRRRSNSNDIDSQVYPLVVNNVVSAAMNLAVELGEAKVTADLVRRV